MKRRTVLALATSALIVSGVVARRALKDPPRVQDTLDTLARLRQSSPVSSGAWNAYQVFTHIAQSIDYSMSGFPEVKSPLFRYTAGKAAFIAFSTAGAMKHNLSEPIPGAPAIPPTGSAGDAIARTMSSLRKFSDYTGPLYPHFAYGNLDKDDYLEAHILHIRNHMQEISG